MLCILVKGGDMAKYLSGILIGLLIVAPAALAVVLVSGLLVTVGP